MPHGSRATDSPLHDAFQQTRWSLIAAVRGGDHGSGKDPLIDLCRCYWYPVYAYARRQGHAAERAFDLMSAFFGHLRDQIRASDPVDGGRFRLFLLERLNRFMAAGGESRPGLSAGGVAPPCTRDEAEARLRAEHAPETAPQAAFDRGFALEVLERSRGKLRDEARASGHLAMFDALEPHLTVDPAPAEADRIAHALGIGTLALQVASRRLRQRFRELVDAELADTVATSADLESERAALLEILARRR